MDPMHFYRTSLAEHLGPDGDLAPPWEQFPNYERYTIGWRMGSGESWLSFWHVFLGDLGAGYEARLAYLKRHPPAPVTWADRVYDVLYPSVSESDAPDEAEQRAELRRLGLIASDAAYPTWLSQQRGVRWPWDNSETPEVTARYWTRDLWFWSRRVTELRGTAAWKEPRVPESWAACADALRSGAVRDPDPRQGLLLLAQVLAAGRVIPPWELGLEPDDFADTFEDDMGCADAFRLWGISALDDREQLEYHLGPDGAPEDWRAWMDEQFHVA